MFSVTLLSPCCHHCSLSRSKLASIVPHLQNPSLLLHTSSCRCLSTLKRVQGSTHVLGSYPHIYLIFPPHSSSLSRKNNIGTSAKLPIKRKHHPSHNSGFTWLVFTRLFIHIIQHMQQAEEDRWSDYRRTHGSPFISCFLVQIFSHFLAALDLGFFYIWNWLPCYSASVFFSHTYSFSFSFFFFVPSQLEGVNNYWFGPTKAR